MDNDVILEILVRLPPVSVVRFKLVSKTWYALISYSNFLFRHSLHYHRHIQQTQRIDRLSDGLCVGQFLLGGVGDDYLIFPPPPNHDNTHPPPPILRILEDNHPLAFFSIDVDDHYPMTKFNFFTLISFSNGLVIFRGHDDIHFDSHDSTYFLCNPVLKQYIELPKMEYKNVPYDSEEDREYDSEDRFKVTLQSSAHTYEPIIVFDPTIISLSYKVFLLRPVHDSDWIDFSLQIYAYSQPTSSSSEITSLWRLITILPDWEHTLDSGNGVLLNGVLYHLCSNEVIICIHVAKEIVWVLDCLSLPMETTPSNYRGYQCQYFGECGGHLQLVVQYHDDAVTFSFPCSLDVFEMEQPQQQHDDDDDQEVVVHSAVWILKYRVTNIRPQSYYDDHIHREHNIHIIRLFKTGRSGEEEALLMKIFSKAGGNGMMLIFNLTSNTFGELLDIPFDHAPVRYSDVFPYTMTLFPLSSSSSS